METVGMGPTNYASHALSSRAFCSEVTDDIGGTSAKPAGLVSSEVLADVRDEHHPGGEIKPELEVVVLL